MSPSLYTPAKVQKMLGLPPSTLRRYSVLFQDFLSESAKSGRKRSYTSGDIAVIQQAKELSSQGMTIQDITKKLDEYRESIIDQSESQQEETITSLALPRILSELEKLAEDNKRRAVQINELRDQLAQERTDREQLAQRLEALEAERRKGLLERIFKRKPPE